MRTKMMMLAVLICLLSGALLLAAQEESPFTLYSPDPVVVHGPFGEWDGRYTDPGAVLYHDGQFHMFRNGFQGWPASVQVGYLTSPDGMTWTEVTEEPVLRSDDVPFTDLAALASSALVMDDGTWVLYFYTWNRSNPPAAEIGRATADNPQGPWTIEAEPVLTHGGEGSWDSIHVDAPSVLRTDDGYVMYYAGSNEANRSAQIGMATSPDGIIWTKYDDLATTEAPFAESDPVLVSEQDDYRYHQPRVERVEDGYLMIYRMIPASGSQMGLGIATSDDGIHWDIQSDEPLWSRANMPNSGGFWYTATAYHDDTLYLYIEGDRGSGTDVFLTTWTP